jgi:hypothetical protein
MAAPRLRAVAVLVEGEFAGWGGFRREEYGVDYTLVLAAQWVWGSKSRPEPVTCSNRPATLQA